MHSTYLNIIFLIVLVATSGVYSLSVNGTLADRQTNALNSDGRVYFYRYKQFIGYRVKPSVYCDESQLARIENGRFFITKVAPGKHTFRSNDKQSGLELDIQAGHTYYIRVEIVDGFLKQYGRLVLMSNEQGAYEISKLKPLSAASIKDRTRVTVDETSSKPR
ncbi:MAG TPA: DUF2846 domain-containing protein [Pyrinomonadaceae bacterium]